MIISDLYTTKMECDTYNLEESDTNLVNLTVTLEDFNKIRVTGKSVKITVDSGYFTKCVGASTETFQNTSTRTITAKTNSNGVITATWRHTGHGLVTFKANDSNIQCFVRKTDVKHSDTGWKVVSLESEWNHWSDSQRLRIRKYDNLVEITGTVTPRYNTNHFVIAVLEAQFRPTKTFLWMNNGSDINGTHEWNALSVTYDGRLQIERHVLGGTTKNTMEQGHWVPIHTTYFVG